MSMARLLIKLPSRERPQTLLRVVRAYATLCADPLNTMMLVSLDYDDGTMTPTLVAQLQQQRMAVSVVFGPRTTKVGAVNRDMEVAGNWDVMLVASDDMWPAMEGYDAVIRKDMATWYPNGNGCLWYSDGRQARVCTMSVMDAKYYATMGHIYHPCYKSYRCDDEYTEKAMHAGRMVKLPTVIATHEHPCFLGAVPDDALYAHNRTHKEDDLRCYMHRKALGYP